MKYLFTLALSLAASVVIAQTYSNLDKAKILYCLLTGRVGNYVEQRDSTYLFDARDRNALETQFQLRFFNMLHFANNFYAYPDFNDIAPTVRTRDAQNPVRHITTSRGGPERFTIEHAKEFFLKMLPYYGDYYLNTGYGSTGVELSRLTGYSPVTVDKEYADLVAWFVHKQFPDAPKDGVRVDIDMGVDGDLKTVKFDYWPDTDWKEMETRLMQKILGRNVFDDKAVNQGQLLH